MWRSTACEQITCPECSGTGKVPQYNVTFTAKATTSERCGERPCNRCSGMGKVPDYNCGLPLQPYFSESP